ncbi:MAG: tetratricopeptide repeat protein [Defluviitaleaceae bacterium]|nr:tetratricopeptide repeat protein [Defluviitaleaceae bacterium]MCL2275422.1 tetratricopeptide repeat protein [Defluviitaleaceae bacterium]
MSKINQFRKNIAQMYHAFELEEAAEQGEALLREHWNNHSMQTLGYAQDIYNLGRVYDELGNFERAIELYTDGAHLFSRQCTGDAAAYTACLNNLAAALFDMGMEEPSAHLFAQLVSVKRYFGHEQDEVFADSLYNLANAITDKKFKENAKRWHNEALTIRKRKGTAADIIDSLHSLAILHEESKEYEKATPLAEAALEAAVELETDDDYVSSAYYLAQLYDASGQYEKALPLYTEVQNRTLARVGRTHGSYLNVVNAKARLLNKLGNAREALTLEHERRALYESIYAPHNDRLYTECLRRIGNLHKQLGEYEQAEQLFLLALKNNYVHGTDMTADIVELIRLFLHTNNPSRALDVLVYALMHSDSRGPGLAELLTRLAIAFNPTGEPAPDTLLVALREMNNRDALQPIIEKWAKWEKAPFIPAFVMPPQAGPDRM